MSGNSKRIPKKKPDHESGFYEEYPAEDELTRNGNSFNVNSRTSEYYLTKMKKTIKNIKNRKKSDIIPPNGFSRPDKKIEEEEEEPPTETLEPPTETDDYVLILSDGEEEEAASTSNSSNTNENSKFVRPDSEKPKPAKVKEPKTVATSSCDVDLELENISRIKKHGGMYCSYFLSLSYLKILLFYLHVCLFIIAML